MKVVFNFSFDPAELNFYGRRSALFSFLLGTLLFLLFVCSYEPFFAELGFYFILIAVIYNTLLLLFIIKGMISQPEFRSQFIFSAFAILLNIPACIAYYTLAESISRSLAD